MSTALPAWLRVHVGRRLRGQAPTAARVLVIGTVAWQVTVWAGARNPPVYAVFAPLMALRSDPFSSLTAVALRVLGVIAGVAVGLSVVALLTPSLAALVVVLGLALLVGMFTGPGPVLNPQVGLSSLLVLSNPAPDAYGITRVWETVMGGLVTIVLAPLLWPPDPHRELTALARECAERLPGVLMGSVAALGDAAAAQDNRVVVAAEAERLVRVREQTRDAERAMRFNPLRRKHRAQVAGLAARLRTVARAGPYADLLAVEAEVLSAREGLSPALRRARAELPAVVEATARVVDGLLAGRDAAGDAAAARRLLERYRVKDPQAVAVALRRPFHRVLDLCVPPSSPPGVVEEGGRCGSADTRDDEPRKT
ncbi:FUSC family protein [Streptomyces sp. NPDC051896]|uniref:FUSC family protein n=1 Tax=Streptomyces sp. NPDC051896 TaxID=3155416 RepID=UPI00343802C0